MRFLKNRRIDKECIFLWLLGIGIFAFILVFYIKFHPLYIFDTDDWTGIADTRVPLPNFNSFNPTRILPEVLMPLATSIGVWILMLFTHDYIGSMCIIFAFVMAVITSMYFLSIYVILKKAFKNKNTLAIMVLFGVVLLHFAPMGGQEGRASYMLYSNSVICLFYYTISALWNAILVMYAIRRSDKLISAKDSKLLIGIVTLWIYFAINSNLFDSIITAVYGGVVILFDILTFIIKGENSRKGFANVCRKDSAWIIILLLWIGSCAFELHGARAASLRTDTSFLASLKTTIGYLKDVLGTLSGLWIYSLLVIIGLAISIALVVCTKKTANEDDKEFMSIAVKLALSAAIVLLYLVLLCAKAGAEYIRAFEVQISWMFYATLLAGVSCSYILKKIPYADCAMPLLLVLMFYSTVMDGKVYLDVNRSGGISVAQIKAFDEYIVQSVVEACDAGKTDVEVRVPEYGAKDNWPIATYAGYHISNTLFVHGLINRQMNITLIPAGSIGDILDDR